MTNIHDTLRKARRYLLLDRDCLYEAVSLKDGTIPDPKDAEDVAEIDALLNEIDEALGDDDPTPHCPGCGAMTREQCKKNGCPEPFYAANH